MPASVLPVAIIGGGLSGLHAARLLHAAGVGFRILEARDRLGGRILSADAAGRPAEDGFDLGPSWFWPGMHADMGARVEALGLGAFPQHDEGDVLVERSPARPPDRFAGFRQAPRSMRLIGGTGALAEALARGLPPGCVRLGVQVTRMALEPGRVVLRLRGPEGQDEQIRAHQVIAALPPRLLEATVELAPPPGPAMRLRWRDTPTWMAPHAKFVAVYERPFWRAAGLSGTAQSMVGPLGEIHDATTASGSAALFGFLGIGADARDRAGTDALTRACLGQLARLFGAEAARPRATLLKDWAADPLTATPADRHGGAHPIPQPGPWVPPAWQGHLSLAGSETGATAPGYLAGAIEAAENAVADTLGRLAGHAPPAGGIA